MGAAKLAWFGLILAALIVAAASWSVDGSTSTDTAQGTEQRIRSAYGSLPLGFEANRGQTNPSVKFLSRGPGYTLFLTPREAVLMSTSNPQDSTQGADETQRRAVLRMKLLGATLQPQLSGVDRLPGKMHYFLGSGDEKGTTNIPTFAKVRYRRVYPGIDLIFYGSGEQLEFDFVLAPGADVGDIRLAFEGSKRVAVSAHGDLVLETAREEIQLLKPVIYQTVGGARQEVSGQYVLLDQRRVGFEVGPYDAREALVIDPILVYSTYLGGGQFPGFWQNLLFWKRPTRHDAGYGIAVDASGNAYVTGSTGSTDFPTANPLQSAHRGAGTNDVFVAKLDPTGSSLIYSTYLGGSRADVAYGIAVDASGNAYITGLTYSKNFPTASPLQGRFGGGKFDAFVAKIDATGSALVYSTFLGGRGVDRGNGIAVDASGNAYVAGSTDSSNFPTVSALQPHRVGSGRDAFVAKLNAAGSRLVYSTYLGGSGSNGGSAIAVDIWGDAYVTGTTNSTDFPTASALQPSFGGGRWDAFVAKLNAAGATLVYSTYLGGIGEEIASGIAVDRLGNAYVVGSTGWRFPFEHSTNFPTVNPLQPTYGGGQSDAFVAKIDSSGSALVYSTYFGGSGYDTASGIAVDPSGHAYVAGSGGWVDFLTANALQPDSRNRKIGDFPDAFVAKLDPDGSALLYSTYVGGSGSEYGYGIAVDGSGDAYVTGEAGEGGGVDWIEFPIRNALQPRRGGSFDAFVARISDRGAIKERSTRTDAPF